MKKIDKRALKEIRDDEITNAPVSVDAFGGACVLWRTADTST
jgi:hypothetical protein